MNPLHSPKTEYGKTEFGKKNTETKFEESDQNSGANLILRPV